MLIPYDSLCQLPKATLDNLIREFLLSQVEDASFDSLGEHNLAAAMAKVHQSLKQGLLLVEYSEEDESIAIRSREDVVRRRI
jgi:uncharacterized protein